jgi:hypothetical protein
MFSEYFMFPYTTRNVSDIATTRCVNKIGLNLLCSTSLNGHEFEIAMQNYVVKHKELLQCEVVCKNLIVAWKGLKYGVRKYQYVVQNVVKAAVVSTSSLFGLMVAGKSIGLNRKRQMLDAKQDGEHCVKGDRIVMKDAISKDVKAIVVKWYFEEIRISPNKKDVIRHQVGHKFWETHATNFLQV